MEKYTTGPRFLVAELGNPGEQHVSYGSPNSENGAVFIGPDRVANAVLDAAAVGLLDAARNVVRAWDNESDLPRFIDELESAIYLATGGK